MPYISVTRLAGSVRRTEATIDSTGVIPEPGGQATDVTLVVGRDRGAEPPAGVITSIVSPGCSSRSASRRTAPSAIRFTPIRSWPCSASSAGVEQIE